MRVSVTTLESFRRYKTPGLCFCLAVCDCEARLIQRIKGVFVPTPKMEAGILFHLAMETGDRSRFNDSYMAALIMSARVGRAPDSPGSHEAKFWWDDCDVRVVGKWDYLSGGVVYDWKTTDKYTAGSYEDSLQWRLTLTALPEVTWFRYDSFRVWQPAGDGLYSVKYLDRQEFSRYPLLEDDCRRWVREFKDYVSLRGLEEWVADRASNEAPF